MALNEDGAGIHATGNFKFMPVDKIIIAAGHKPNARLIVEVAKRQMKKALSLHPKIHIVRLIALASSLALNINLLQ